jgi:hypothetical protein
MQCVDVLRGQRAEAEAHLGAGRDHVGLDPAFDSTDVEAQAGQATEARVRLRFDKLQRARPSARPGAARSRRPSHSPEAWPACTENASAPSDAAMREHRFAARRFGDDRFTEAVIARKKAAMQRASLASSSVLNRNAASPFGCAAAASRPRPRP